MGVDVDVPILARCWLVLVLVSPVFKLDIIDSSSLSIALKLIHSIVSPNPNPAAARGHLDKIEYVRTKCVFVVPTYLPHPNSLDPRVESILEGFNLILVLFLPSAACLLALCSARGQRNRQISKETYVGRAAELYSDMVLYAHHHLMLSAHHLPPGRPECIWNRQSLQITTTPSIPRQDKTIQTSRCTYAPQVP